MWLNHAGSKVTSEIPYKGAEEGIGEIPYPLNPCIHAGLSVVLCAVFDCPGL